jgi:predicted amino acid racemase
MFLSVVTRRNPALVDASVQLHRTGAIPANCYVVDLDGVQANAHKIGEAAARHRLDPLQMTKQFGRNPAVARAIAVAGIRRAVAVDIEEAHTLHESGIRIGHLGHLVQVPSGELDAAVAEIKPEQITVMTIEQAQRVAAAAARNRSSQRLLLRVRGDHDFQFAGQRGGVPLPELLTATDCIDALDGVTFGGVTSFPCLLWDDVAQRLTPTANLETLSKAREMLTRSGRRELTYNAPGANCIAAMSLLADAGATQIEPGSALIGATPLHAATDQPEVPAMVYITEVSHSVGATTYVLGGGFYARSRLEAALVFTRSGTVSARAELGPAGEIDYYGSVTMPAGTAAHAGDTVVYSFRSQVFVTRAAVAVVEDLAAGGRLVGIYDAHGRLWRRRNDDIPRPAHGTATQRSHEN